MSDFEPNPTDVETLLRRVADLVGNARPVPLSASVMISRDEVLELVDEALARLPEVVVAPRWDDRPGGVVLLDVADHHLVVSSSEVRSGRSEWMLPEAAAFDERTGAWSDPVRYSRWIEGARA